MTTKYAHILDAIRGVLDDQRMTENERLHQILRMTARHRAGLLANTLIHGGGTRVRSGPFAGMTMPVQAAEGCIVPKLLGCYEAELHPVLEEIAHRGYEAIINVGCAEGYYAVGFARYMTDSRIYAYDVDENARKTIAEVARINGVADRIEVGELFTHDDFATFTDRHSLVFCDIEGAELELLDPEKAPALAGMDMLVEIHNAFETNIYQRFAQRFRQTHRIELKRPSRRDIDRFPELRNLEHLDQLLAFWEYRRGPTPWLFMNAINPNKPK